MLFSQLSSSYSVNMLGHTAMGGLAKCHPITPLPSFVAPNYMVNSEFVAGIKPGACGLMIGYQFDEFTCTWSAEHFDI